jgi:hypothetical protein
LLNALSEIVLVLFLDLELELSKSIVYLTIEIYSITDVLEVLIDKSKMSILFNELFNISDWLREI